MRAIAKYYLIIVSVIFLLFSCNSQKKFSKETWLEDDGTLSFPYRNSMLKDLTTNYRLKGLSYKQVIALIGEPSQVDSNTFCYRVQTKYDVVDPVYTKDLYIKLSNDSVVELFRIEEWTKKEE